MEGGGGGGGGVYAEPLSSRRLRFFCIALLRSVTNLWLALLVDERRLLRSEASCRTMIHVVCQPHVNCLAFVALSWSTTVNILTYYSN